MSDLIINGKELADELVDKIAELSCDCLRLEKENKILRELKDKMLQLIEVLRAGCPDARLKARIARLEEQIEVLKKENLELLERDKKSSEADREAFFGVHNMKIKLSQTQERIKVLEKQNEVKAGLIQKLIKLYEDDA